MPDTLIHCIHDLARTDRMELLQKEIQTHELNVRFWPAIKDPWRSFMGVAMAHKQIVSWAMSEGLDEVLIMEDDCYFLGPGAFQFFVEHKPASYDLYLGNVFFPPQLNGNPRISDFCGLTLYYAHSRFYGRFLTCRTDNHLDRTLGAMEAEKYVCLPMVCSQHDGYSDNKKGNGWYGMYLLTQDLYGTLPNVLPEEVAKRITHLHRKRPFAGKNLFKI